MILPPLTIDPDAAQVRVEATASDGTPAVLWDEPAPARWRGWWRKGPRARWHAAVETDTPEAAWDWLLDTGASWDKCVLPVGQDPNVRRKCDRR